jgi:hypothetical protein
MAERLRRGVWAIRGTTLTLPVTIPSARLTAAVFAAPVAGARSVLDGTPLRPLRVAGRALSLLMCLHYDDWALESYDEVGVGLFAVGPRGRPGLYLTDLPVTGAFTREAGQDLWALPKWLMECDLRFGAAATSVAVGGVFSGRLRHEGVRLPGVRAFLPSWSYLDHGAQAGKLLRGRVPMRLSGVRLGRSCSIELESHPMAGRMRALGMLGRPLLTVHAERLHGPLGEYTAVSRKA